MADAFCLTDGGQRFRIWNAFHIKGQAIAADYLTQKQANGVTEIQAAIREDLRGLKLQIRLNAQAHVCGFKGCMLKLSIGL